MQLSEIAEIFVYSVHLTVPDADPPEGYPGSILCQAYRGNVRHVNNKKERKISILRVIYGLYLRPFQ
jgi:hypothetical protein